MNKSQTRVAVIGTPEHEGRMVGRAFEILGSEPEYLAPTDPQIPNSPSPDVILVSREWSLAIREAVCTALRKEIPVVYLMDGVLDWNYLWDNWNYVKPEGTVLQPLLATHLAVIGRHPARILASLGLADRTRIVGLPRLDSVKRERLIDKNSKPRIVIATARTFALNVAQQVYIRAALRDLKSWFDSQSTVEPIWRIAEDLACDLGVTPTTDVPIVEALRVSSGLLSFASTVLLEGMVVGVPTACVDYRPIPQLIDTAWEIRSAEHIDGVVRELLYPSSERLTYQETCLRDELELGDASSRLADLLSWAASNRGRKSTAQRGTEGDNGMLDYRHVHSHLSAFSVSPSSRLQYELDAMSKLREADRSRLTRVERESRELKLLITELKLLIRQLPKRLFTRLLWVPGFRRLARCGIQLIDRVDRLDR